MEHNRNLRISRKVIKSADVMGNDWGKVQSDRTRDEEPNSDSSLNTPRSIRPRHIFHPPLTPDVKKIEAF